MKAQKTPLLICNDYKNDFPGCYEHIEEMRDKAREEYGINTECDMPIAISIEYLEEEQNCSHIEAVNRAPELSATYIWRKHKIIYDFDDTLAEELCDQANDFSEDAALPIEIMLHPPYPCVYIRSGIPSKGCDDDGFFAWVEVDAETEVKELRIQFVNKDFDETYGTILELTKPTIGECIEDTNRTRMRNYPKLFPENNLRTLTTDDKIMFRAMQLYLYICSEQADVQDNPTQRQLYRPRKAGQPIKDKFRELEIKDVGFVIGSTLRKAQSTSNQSHSNGAHEPRQGSHKRPHTRRGHWHHYWTGARNMPDQRKLVLKWTHPILVGGYADTVTLVPVSK